MTLLRENLARHADDGPHPGFHIVFLLGAAAL
jgi:hypothetical protein